MRRLALVAPVVGLLLVGCSDDAPDPKIAPTPTAPPSSSASAPTSDPAPTGPVEPTLPPEAEGTDAGAAEAFVGFYWEMVNYAQATGDVQGLRALGAESCVACQAGIAFITDTYGAGGTVRGGEVSTSQFVTERISAPGGYAFQVRLELANSRQVVDLPGDVDDEVRAAQDVEANVIVTPSDQGWSITFWEIA